MKIAELEKSFEEIRRMYVDEEMPACKIAKHFGFIGHSQFIKLLKKHGIEIRKFSYYNLGEKHFHYKKLPEDKIVEEYSSTDITTRDLAKKNNVSQGMIVKILKKYNVDAASKGNRLRGQSLKSSAWQNQEEIIQLYLKGKNQEVLAKLNDCVRDVIHDILKKNNVKIRPSLGYPKGHKLNVGRECKESTREKIRKSKTGTKSSPESVAKMKASKKGICPNIPHLFKKGMTPWNKDLTAETDSRVIAGERHHMYGVKLTDLQKQKSREYGALAVWPFYDTKIEIKIQNFLKELEVEFLTHQYISQITHVYRCDIFIRPNTIIECDGDYWHANPKFYTDENINDKQRDQREEDYVRTQELIEKGFRVLRLWEYDIKRMDLNKFKEIISELNISEVKCQK